ncbi:hypothetical protein [Streptomyces sp. SID12501]|uniref:Uncharacterized protein n=1 Tax=Streptomyces sp. SID12501 TaxID=2706042 RepID=A0A6B3BWR0_9ACTN|nr:hypothetical protein [Streptomyces sp. SID12501]NEC88732.1 hypothetical protein [Streptomyces sp. SID12501]
MAEDPRADPGHQPDCDVHSPRSDTRLEAEDRLADMLLLGEPNAGDRVCADAADAATEVRVCQGAELSSRPSGRFAHGRI